MCGKKKEDTLWRTESLVLSDVLIGVGTMLSLQIHGEENNRRADHPTHQNQKVIPVLTDFIGDASAKVIGNDD